MKKVLVSNIMMLAERERFDAEIRGMGYEPIWPDVSQFLDEAACLDWAGEIDGWLAGDDQITRAVLEKAAPRLKVISKWGTGVDSIDRAAAAAIGVPICNSPGAFADAVAEVALGYMLSLRRSLVAVDRAVRGGAWPKPRGLELRGSTLGVIGFGAIGRRIGDFASGFGMRVIYSDPFVDGAVDMRVGDVVVGQAAKATPEALAAEADIVCLACNLTPENRGLVDAAFLAQMRPTALLVNVARGPIVDEPALIAALREGRIAGAGLDVFAIEPVSTSNPLLAMENVVVGSHNANNGAAAVEAVHRNTLANLAEHLEP